LPWPRPSTPQSCGRTSWCSPPWVGGVPCDAISLEGSVSGGLIESLAVGSCFV
jgi:hypothetical protein